ncbi:MAG: cryptochrome/photolyase family protein [Candidatus Dojkabacteria bacterium]
MNFVWFRIDLRLKDNRILETISQQGKQVIPIFILDPKLIQDMNCSRKRLSFMAESILHLSKQLEDAGSRLVVVKADPIAFWRKFSSKAAVHVTASRDYTAYSTRRDTAVASLLEKNHGSFTIVKNIVVYDAHDRLETKNGTPIKTFTRFKTEWLKSLHSSLAPIEFVYSPEQVFLPVHRIEDCIKRCDITEFHRDELEHFVQKHSFFRGGEDVGYRKWEVFKSEKLLSYHTKRDHLYEVGTSKLSPHYHWGTMSVHRAVRDCIAILGDSFYDFRAFSHTEKAGVEAYLSELIWRDFYKYVLAHAPHAQCSNYNTSYDRVQWLENDTLLEAWKEGSTGFPVVDACMRQLNKNGWMHNRGRMIVASFLTKDLHIHWKKGERYFMERLADLDIASNNGGWQWVAGTGTDASPYFRIFNPVSQGKKYDPDGIFIKSYIPELRRVPKQFIHEPWKMSKELQESSGCRVGREYPLPIVDHQTERMVALDLYKRKLKSS